ncbi:MAG: endolytic transglycosylase MltG [Eubacterium sp.]|nr:endolytic transglycosylase MltG [Eubacterium sp.]MDD7210396.1 hypothetical protein [Lachnospiraceae bacterium]MDY5498036.1 hypothetical protein [Anaerobutyricum sp.]
MTENIIRIIIKILSVMFIILLFIYLFVEMKNVGYTVFSDNALDSPQEAREALLIVEEKEPLLTISKDLAEQDVIGNPYLFALSLRCMDGYENIKPGEYEVFSSEKPSDILKKLTHEEAENQ